MKQPVTLSRTLMDPSEKDIPIRKNSGKDNPNEPSSEDAKNLPIGHSQEEPNFDFSNFSMFFKNKGGNMKTINEGAPTLPSFASNRKRSNETSFGKESAMKRMPSKEFSNLDELFEDTTVITNPGEFVRTQSKKFSSELPHFKPSNYEEAKETHHEVPFFNLGDKGSSKKESSPPVYSGGTKLLKEDRSDNEWLANITKVNPGNGDEYEKSEAFFKDSKFLPQNINPEVMERIKSKALHHRHASLATSANLSNTSSSGSSNLTQGPHSESRTNNNSVFTGVRKINKASTPVNSFIKKETDDNIFHLDPIKDSINSMLYKFESDDKPDILRIEDLLQSSPQAKEVKAHSQSPFIGPMDIKDLSKSLDNNENKKSRLSTIATDSTVDSENFNTLTFNHQHHHPHHHHSNSFSTFFNAKSNSYNNSGRIDFSSPVRVDSGRLNNEKHTNSFTNINMSDPPQNPGTPGHRNLFNFDPNLIGYYGASFGGSNNNTDSGSNSLSWNDEYVNTFGSNMSTPQERQQNYLNQSLNINPSPSMDHQYMSSVQISPHTLKNRVNRSYTAHAANKSSQGITNFSSNQFKDLTPSSSGKELKEGNKSSKKKNSEAKDTALFEIDLTKLEANGKTTLMIRNIPNKYDQSLMLQTIERNHKGKFDFFYLPIDPRNKCNVGYAFINFTEPRHIKEFVIEFNNKKWEKFNSEKICDIKYGRIQGKKSLMHHFQYSNVMNQQDKKLKPYFSADYEGMNHQRIKDLVTKQKLESADDNLDNYQE